MGTDVKKQFFGEGTVKPVFSIGKTQKMIDYFSKLDPQLTMHKSF